LKIASPGVPDTYQGTEIWDFSLVDPDNRRPVDYTRRSRMLQPMFKGVWYVVMNFAPLPLSDTSQGQYPRPHR
jgi:maltooligosyltrehalose synthase